MAEPTPAEWAAQHEAQHAQDIAIELARTFLDEWERGDGGNAATCDAAITLRDALTRYDQALDKWEAAQNEALRPGRGRR